MKTLLLAILALTISNPEGYYLTGSNIHFIYPFQTSGLEVHVSANFNERSKAANWKMTYRKGVGYELTKPITAIRKPGKSFYEFTFRVNGKLIDANPKAPNVIHCVGYGSQYLIHF